jgi:hypothetical protein
LHFLGGPPVIERQDVRHLRPAVKVAVEPLNLAVGNQDYAHRGAAEVLVGSDAGEFPAEPGAVHGDSPLSVRHREAGGFGRGFFAVAG